MSIYPVINPADLEREARKRERRADEAIAAIRAFLHALDSGWLGVTPEDFMIGPPGDRAETAFLADLRRIEE